MFLVFVDGFFILLYIYEISMKINSKINLPQACPKKKIFVEKNLASLKKKLSMEKNIYIIDSQQ